MEKQTPEHTFAW